MGHLLKTRYVWAGKIYVWKEDTIYMRQKREGRVQDYSKVIVTNSLDKGCMFGKRKRNNTVFHLLSEANQEENQDGLCHGRHRGGRNWIAHTPQGEVEKA